MQVVNIRAQILRDRGYNDLSKIPFLQWKANPKNLYVGRFEHYVEGATESKWNNPFHVLPEGKYLSTKGGKMKYYTREESLRLYEEHIRNTPELWDALEELRDLKELGCWCKPLRCHGDVLVKLVKEKFGSEGFFKLEFVEQKYATLIFEE